MIQLHFLFVIVLIPPLCLTLEPVSKNGCGTAKGCYFKPKACEPMKTCIFGVTYKKTKDGQSVDFELFVKRRLPITTQFIAVGFSEDKTMGNDAITECIYDSNKVIRNDTIFLSYNPAKSNERINMESSEMKKLIKIKSIGVVDNYFICQFTQIIDHNMAALEGKVFILDKSYHLMLATGTTTGTNGINIHTTDQKEYDFPSVTTQKVNVAQEFTIGSENENEKKKKFTLQKVHGILMIFGWWIFIIIAILFARYFKGLWPEHKPAGLFLWFHFHRGFTLFGVLLVIVSFICMVINQGIQLDHPHPIIGFISCLIIVSQPIGSLFRCKPQDSKRKFFNWIHRLLGILGFVLATIAIFLSTRFESHGLSDKKNGSTPLVLMIMYVIGLVVLAASLEAVVSMANRQNTNITKVIPVTPMDAGPDAKPETASMPTLVDKKVP